MPSESLRPCATAVLDLLQQHPALSSYTWPGRGRAPAGYLKGMLLVYARVYCKWKAQDPYVVAMAKGATSDASADALTWFKQQFVAAHMAVDVDGVDTLRHLFVLLVGLGMRESSGRYSEGRDLSADNVSSTTAEAGLFQMSYSIGVGSAAPQRALLKNQYDQLKASSASGYRGVFEEGVVVKRGELIGFGSGNGGAFRKFCVMQPGLSAEIAALGLRMRRKHFGPINERTVTLNADCDALLSLVQDVVDQGACCAEFAAESSEDSDG